MRKFLARGFVSIAVLLLGSAVVSCSGNDRRAASFQSTAGPTTSTMLVITRNGTIWSIEPEADRVAKVSANGAVRFFRLSAGSHPNSICVGPDGAVWFTETGDNRIGRVDELGRISEYIVPGNSGLTSIASAPSRGLWFIESHAKRIGYISLTGAVREFPVRRETSSIAVASDGDVVAAAIKAPWLMRISQDGAYRQIPLR